MCLLMIEFASDHLTINTYRGQDVSLTIRHAELEQKGNPDA